MSSPSASPDAPAKKPHALAADLEGVVTDAHLLDDDALARAGFPARAREQEHFLAVVIGRRGARPELTTRPGLGALAGTLLLVVASLAQAARGALVPTVVAALGAAVCAVIAVAERRAVIGRARRDGPADPRAAFLDDEGALAPRLEPGERELWRGDPGVPERPVARRLLGVVFAAWGALLAGLPLATVPVGAGELGRMIAVALASAFGALVFGRGVDALVGQRGIAALAITTRRVVLLARPGVAHSVALEGLRHRPAVVAHADGTATLALDLRPQKSAAPLPVQSLLAVTGLRPELAARLAGQVMDARKDALRAGLVVDGPR